MTESVEHAMEVMVVVAVHPDWLIVDGLFDLIDMARVAPDRKVSDLARNWHDEHDEGE